MNHRLSPPLAPSDRTMIRHCALAARLKQGQYLAFIDAYTRVHRRPPPNARRSTSMHCPRLRRTLLSSLRSYSASPAEAVSVVLGGSRSERSFTSLLSRRTISVVLRMSASLKSAPIVEAIARNRALNSR